MSSYGKEYAPNLFDNYTDWYDNMVDILNIEPTDEMKDEALEYFGIIRQV